MFRNPGIVLLDEFIRIYYFLLFKDIHVISIQFSNVTFLSNKDEESVIYALTQLLVFKMISLLNFFPVPSIRQFQSA